MANSILTSFLAFLLPYSGKILAGLLLCGFFFLVNGVAAFVHHHRQHVDCDCEWCRSEVRR